MTLGSLTSNFEHVTCGPFDLSAMK